MTEGRAAWVWLTGEDEVMSALESVAAFDQAAAGKAAAQAILPDVQSGTRYLTGAASAAWLAVDGGIENATPYIGFIEYGTEHIQFGSEAVWSAWQRNQDAVVKAYEAEIDSAARAEGFQT